MTDYDYFMVYELFDSGEEQRIEVDEINLQEILHPDQVFVIVKEDARRIFIWKGAKSPVRKRFISSRVASKLQENLIKEAAFHRCKIVSVDQGDEPIEFLKTFRLESMEVKEKLDDLRYIRNIEKDSTIIRGQVVDTVSAQKEEEEYYSPALEELKKKGIDVSSNSIKETKSSVRPMSTKKYEPSSTKLAKSDKKDIIKRILANELPTEYKRQNLIIGQGLFGAVSKITNVFGEDIEETEWEQIEKLPKGIYLLDNYLYRVYFNANKGIVEGIEILKPDNDTKGKPIMEKTTLKLPDGNSSIDKKILELEIPKNHHRENLIIGYNLYGVISKKIEVFGQEQEEEEWTSVKKFPKDMISLSSHLFRIYFSEKNIDAVEIVKKGNKTDSNTVSKRNLPKIPSND